MTPQSEFVPIGKHVSVSHPLDLDFMDQQHLTYELKQTGKELETNPLATPSYKEVKLGRIALLGLDGNRSARDKLWVQFSETNDGRRSASIGLFEEGENTHMQLSHNNNQWEVWPSGSKTPSQVISNEQVVAAIHPKLRNKEILGPLQDLVDYDSMIIPHLFESFLEKYAHRREKRIIYRTSDPLFQTLSDVPSDIDTSFASTVGTDLSIYQNNTRFVHKLATRAPYSLGATNIQKEYSYAAETSDKVFYSSKGQLVVSSSDGYSAHQLANYAAQDQFNNEPLFSLHRSLGSLRTYYGLEETAA